MERAVPGRASANRTYRSPLRAQQAQRTRELILAAYADLVVAGRSSNVTMAAVAARAGVAERTVYRHFPSGQSLLDGLSEQASAVMRERGAELAGRSLDDAIGRAGELYRGFEAAGPPLKAAIIAGLDAGYRSPGQSGRVDHIREALREEFPGLAEDELAETVVLLRFQLGGWAWYLLTEREGLSTEQAARLSARAAGAVLADLRREARRRRGA
jgi:AcrR family transcriptional regulator